MSPKIGEPRRAAYVPVGSLAEDVQTGTRLTHSENIAVAVGWISLALIIAGLGWAVIQFREAIASAWPQSASLYAAMGLKVNASGIDITNVASRQSREDGQTVLAIRGRLINITSHAVSVPDMSVKLSDDDQHELDHWSFAPPERTLKPGEAVNFATRRTNPPQDAHHLEVSFAEAGG